MPRGAAIAVVYLGIVITPIVIGAILIVPAVEQGVRLANNLPEYVQDLNEAFDENEQLRQLNEDYDITDEAGGRGPGPDRRGSATPPARSRTSAPAIVSSIFALVTILVMSMFMVSRGKAVARRGARAPTTATRPSGSGARSTGSPSAVGSYVGGALAPGDDRRHRARSSCS